MRTVIRVIVIGLLGGLVLAGCGTSRSSTAPTSTAAPSAAPPSAAAASAPAPTSASLPMLPASGSVLAGTYTLDSALGITMDVPAGWETCCGGALVKNDFDGILYDRFTDGVTVYGDPCKWSTGSSSQPKGAEAVAAALAAQPGREASQPKGVTLGGLPAFHVRLVVPADQKVTSVGSGNFEFDGCDQGEFRSFTDGSGDTRYHQAPTQTDDFYFVDVDGRTFVLDVVSGPEMAAAEKSALDAMVASVRID